MATYLPTVQRRKHTEEQASPILLIGSRADSHDFGISTKDWDLIIPHSTLITLMQHHYEQFSWLSIHRGEFPKIKGRLINGQVVEIEVVENYASTEHLYNEKFFVNDWRQYTSNSFGVGQIKLKLASQNALLALKYSTCFFPANWTKNIRQLVEMKNRMGYNSFNKLFETQDLRQLMALRSRETIARCTHYKQFVRKQIVTKHDVVTSGIARTSKLYNTEASDWIYFSLTGIKIDRAKFLTATEDHKRIIIQEQLTLLEQYFASYGAHRAKELALEAFITQSVPPNWYEDMNAIMTMTRGVYTKSAYRTPELQNRLDDFEYDDFFDAPFIDHELYATYLKNDLPKHKAPLASEQDLNESTFSNVAIVWAMDHIEEFFDRPPMNIVQQSNITINLPGDVWHTIANNIDDHITLAVFEQVCKAAKHAVNWKNLALNCWSETDLEKYQEEIAAPHPNWKLIFRELYRYYIQRKLYMCTHCGGNHFILAPEEWDKYAAERNSQTNTEAYDYYCYCPLCDVGSWGSCKHHPHYIDYSKANQTPSRTCSIQ
jgi:hypothetical protein